MRNSIFIQILLSGSGWLVGQAVKVKLARDKYLPWTYASHGADWVGAETGFCKDAQAKYQSPVDLGESVKDDVNMLWYWYPRLGEPLKVYNNGYSLSATLPEHYKGGFGYGVLPDLEQYRLVQFTFHAPSEHTLNGVRQPLELQLTHSKRGSDRLGITSIFFAANGAGPVGGVPFLDELASEGLPDQAWAEVMTNLAAKPKASTELPGSYTDRDVMFNQAFEPVVSVFPEPEPVQFYRYNGSLTIPPCTQNVDWFVRQEPLRVAKATLATITDALERTVSNGNWREVQLGNFGTGTAERTSPVLISAEWYGKKSHHEAPTGPPPVPPAPPVTPEEIGLHAEIFETVFGNETAEQLEAKEQVQRVLQNARASMAAYESAESDLESAQNALDLTLSEDTDEDADAAARTKAQFDVQHAQNRLQDAAAFRAETVTQSNEVLAKYADVLNSLKPAGTEPVQVSTADDEVLPPLDKNFIPGKEISYPFEAKHPIGEAANPFVPGTAERTVRYGMKVEGTNQTLRSVEYMHQSLKMPDAPYGMMPPPQVVESA